MSFLGGPECSTGANPLAQFQKQTSTDTSLQRDRLTNLQPMQLNGFRSGQQRPDDAAFQEFSQQGPHMGEMLPNEAFHLEQMRREQEQFERSGGGGGGAGNGAWAGEFAQQGPRFSPEEFTQQQQRNGGGAFNPQDFAQFRQSQMSPRTQSPGLHQAAYSRPPMYGGGFGMQRPMMGGGFQSAMYNPQPQQQYEGKGKARVQELSDTDWEKQFEELSTADKDADLEQLDREADEAVEKELNELDR